MKKVQIFEPPACCAGGACGPVIDPEMAQLADAVRRLTEQGVEVERVLLNQSPQAFMSDPIIADLMRKEGKTSLPVTMVGGQVVATGRYLTLEEMESHVSTE